MKTYEVMYILKPCDDDNVKKVVAKVAKTITSNGGVVVKSDIWGEKRLAYTINDCEKGIYILDTFNMDEERVKELVRVMDISEDIIRYMIISKH